MEIEKKWLDRAKDMDKTGEPIPVYVPLVDEESLSYAIHCKYGEKLTVRQRAAILQVMNQAMNDLKPFFPKEGQPN